MWCHHARRVTGSADLHLPQRGERRFHMSRAETIEALKGRRTTIQKWMGQMSEYLGPYPHGPGREQLLAWALVLKQIDRDLEALGEGS